MSDSRFSPVVALLMLSAICIMFFSSVQRSIDQTMMEHMSVELNFNFAAPLLCLRDINAFIPETHRTIDGN